MRWGNQFGVIGIGPRIYQSSPSGLNQLRIDCITGGRHIEGLALLMRKLADDGIALVDLGDLISNQRPIYPGQNVILLPGYKPWRPYATLFTESPKIPVVLWLDEDEEDNPDPYWDLNRVVVRKSVSGDLDELYEVLRQLCLECSGLLSQRPESLIQIPAPSDRDNVTLCDNWGELLAHLDRDFSDIYRLEPRKFEELVAELLTRTDYKVELTPPKSDGGRDILAYHESELGRHLHLFECKRYALHNKVGVHLVRSLFGVLSDENATSAILITTSEFTRGALQLEARNAHRLALRDHRYLQEWIRRVRMP